MWDLVALALGIGIGVAGLAAYVKTNLEARRDAREYKSRLEELETIIREGQRIDPSVLIKKQKNLIASAEHDIWICGINALGVFHESFEDIISFMASGGNLRVLLLNPDSEAFEQREEREEGTGRNKSGRLRAEYMTSVAYCKDIGRLSGNGDSLRLRVYSHKPEWALLVRDTEQDAGMMHINEFATAGVRGYSGVHRFIVNKLQADAFREWIQTYEARWTNAKEVALQEDVDRVDDA